MSADGPQTAPATGDAHARWSTALDELDDLVCRQAAALDRTDAADANLELMFRPPDDLPPPPAAFADRLERIRCSTEALVARAQQASDRVAPRAHVSRRQPPTRSKPSRFDHRG